VDEPGVGAVPGVLGERHEGGERELVRGGDPAQGVAGLTVTVTIGGRRIAFALAMTRLTRCSRVAGGQGSLRRLTLSMSAWTTTVLRLIGRPVALGHQGHELGDRLELGVGVGLRPGT
jgi:hypothetical protein